MRESGAHGETSRGRSHGTTLGFHSRSKGWWGQGVPSRPLYLTSLQAASAQGHP